MSSLHRGSCTDPVDIPVMIDHARSCELLHRRDVRLALIERTLVSPTALVQYERRCRECEEQEQVVHGQRLGLEDGLHEGYVYECELRQERHPHGDH
jgi:hypothetical protein